MKLINSSHKMRPKVMACTHSLTPSVLEVELKWIIAALQGSLWRIAKRTKLCGISLHHSYSGSNHRNGSGRMQLKEFPLTCCKALRKLFSLTGELQGSLHYSDFTPLFADSVAWYLKICINRNPLNKKRKWKLDVLKLHDLHAMLNINAVWCNCRLLHMEKNHYFWEGNDPCGDLQRFKANT